MSNLAVKEYREVDFYGDQILGVKVDENGQETVYVPVKRMCENLGLDFASQRKHILRKTVLKKGVVIMTIPIKGIDGVIQPQEMFCLRYDRVPYWLAIVNEDRVKDECRHKLIKYQEEVADVLAQVFLGKGYALNQNPQAVDLQSLLRDVEKIKEEQERLRLEKARMEVTYQFLDKHIDKLCQTERSFLIYVMGGVEVPTERTYTLTEAAKIFSKEFGYNFTPILMGRLVTQAGIRPKEGEKENEYCLISISKARGSNRVVNILKLKPAGMQFMREYLQKNYFPNKVTN